MSRVLSIVLMSFLILQCGEDAPKGPARVAGIQASSEHEAETGKYRAEFLLHKNGAASWVEGKPDDGIGESVTFLLTKKAKISRISIWNGFGDPKYYPLNNRVKEFAISADNGTETAYTLTDSPKRQEIDLKNPLKGKQITLKIVSVYKGTKWSDTALSGVRFLEKDGDTFHEFSTSPELDERVRAYYLKASTDEFIGLYSDERNTSVHYFLQIGKNGQCQIIALTTYSGTRDNDSCTWKRNGSDLIVRKNESTFEKTYNLKDNLLKIPGNSASQDGSNAMAALTDEYRKVLSAVDAGGYDPKGYIEEKRKSYLHSSGPSHNH